jgi:hypothetical protein
MSQVEGSPQLKLALQLKQCCPKAAARRCSLKAAYKAIATAGRPGERGTVLGRTRDRRALRPLLPVSRSWRRTPSHSQAQAAR